MALTQAINKIIKDMQFMKKRTIDSYLDHHESERGSFQLRDYSECQIPNFWQINCREEQKFVDSIFFRSIEWCEIGLFDDWIERYIKNFNRNIYQFGVEKKDAIINLFTLCRSNIAIAKMNPDLNRILDALLVIDDHCQYPWQYYAMVQTETGKERSEKISDLSLAATIVFAHYQLNREIDCVLSEKIGSLLLCNQLSDGSWAFEENFAQGSFESTCMVLTAIYILKPRGWEYAVEKGKKWLLKNQSPEGFWYGYYISTFITVFVLDTLNLLDGKDELTYNYCNKNLGNITLVEKIGRNLGPFKISLSFPGEYRRIVEQVANGLTSIYGKDSIFYDQYYQSILARPNLDVFLQDIYYNHSDLIVVFVCNEYNEKEWPGLEWRAIRTHILENRGNKIMLLKVGDGNVDGIFKIDGHLDIQAKSPDEIIKSIKKRYEYEFPSLESSKNEKND